MSAVVRYETNGVTVTGTVVGQEKTDSGRWLYEVQPTNPAQLTEKLHFSELQVVRAESPTSAHK